MARFHIPRDPYYPNRAMEVGLRRIQKTIPKRFPRKIQKRIPKKRKMKQMMMAMTQNLRSTILPR